MKHVKKVAEDFRKQNGNINLTQKDMLMYLVTKVDSIATKSDQNSASITMLKWAGTTAIAVVGIIATVVGALY